jgi:hypothetical protein
VIDTRPLPVGTKVGPPSITTATPRSLPVLAIRIVPEEGDPPMGVISIVISRTPPEALRPPPSSSPPRPAPAAGVKLVTPIAASYVAIRGPIGVRL